MIYTYTYTGPIFSYGTAGPEDIHYTCGTAAQIDQNRLMLIALRDYLSSLPEFTINSDNILNTALPVTANWATNTGRENSWFSLRVFNEAYCFMNVGRVASSESINIGINSAAAQPTASVPNVGAIVPARDISGDAANGVKQMICTIEIYIGTNIVYLGIRNWQGARPAQTNGEGFLVKLEQVYRMSFPLNTWFAWTGTAFQKETTYYLDAHSFVDENSQVVSPKGLILNSTNIAIARCAVRRLPTAASVTAGEIMIDGQIYRYVQGPTERQNVFIPVVLS